MEDSLSTGNRRDNASVVDDEQLGLEDVDMSPSKMKFRDNDNNILDGAGSEVDNVGH
jgi:hypothetical protein